MSLPEEDIEKALFAKAKEYTALDLFFGNVDEAPDPTGVGHVVVTHFRNGNDAYSLAGDGDTKAIGFLQMLLRLPRGRGTNEARKRGADIVALFWTPANLCLQSGATRVRISKRPVMGSAVPNKAWYETPISVYYEAFI